MTIAGLLAALSLLLAGVAAVWTTFPRGGPRDEAGPFERERRVLSESASAELETAWTEAVAQLEERVAATDQEIPDYVDFIPIPNGGAFEFDVKYGYMDFAAAENRCSQLRLLVDNRILEAAAERFKLGLFERRLLTEEELRAENPSEGAVELPRGVGRVYPSTLTRGTESKLIAVITTFMTEAEYPKLWSQLDEYRFLFGLVHTLRKSHDLPE